jgi:hypothetical protein
MINQGLHDAAQYGGKLELAVFRLRNPDVQLHARDELRKIAR